MWCRSSHSRNRETVNFDGHSPFSGRLPIARRIGLGKNNSVLAALHPGRRFACVGLAAISQSWAVGRKTSSCDNRNVVSLVGRGCHCRKTSVVSRRRLQPAACNPRPMTASPACACRSGRLGRQSANGPDPLASRSQTAQLLEGSRPVH